MPRTLIAGSLLSLSLLTLVPAQTSGPYLLEVQKLGTGQGTVTSLLPGIDCGSACSGVYPAGTEVTLTAVPGPGNFFAGWSGACSGTAHCTVVIDAATRVSALFATDTSNLTWAKFYTFGNSAGVDISTILSTPDGGMLTVGKRSYYNEIELMKLNQAGSLEWQRAFKGLSYTGNQIPLLGVSGGYFLIAGGNFPQGQLIKLDQNGNFLWRKDYQFSAGKMDVLSAMAGDGSGGAMVAGGSWTPWLMRIDSDGNLLWQRSFPSNPDFGIDGIERLPDGGYLAVGGTEFSALRVLRLNAVGEVLWAKGYAVTPVSPFSRFLFSRATISLTEDGGSFVVGGDSYATIAIRLNAEGEAVWGKCFGSGSYPDYFYNQRGEVIEDGYLLSANGDYSLGTKGRGWLARLDAEGNVVWQHVYGGPSQLTISTTRALSDGGILIGGSGWAGRLDEAGYISSCPLVYEHSFPSVDVTVSTSSFTLVPQFDALLLSEASSQELASDVAVQNICPDTLPVISVDGGIIRERDYLASVPVTIRLSKPSPLPISFSYQTVDGEAKAELDFWNSSNTVSLNPGTTEKTIYIYILSDAIEESDETFSVLMTDVRNAIVAGATTLTIIDTNSTRNLAVLRQGTGSGTVTSSPQGIDCGTFCSTALKRGTAVTLSATPDPGSAFVGFQAPGCAPGSSCTFNLDASTVVVAEFRAEFTVSVTRTGNGAGTVTSGDGGINCGTACVAAYQPGSNITLNAAPEAGSSFLGWGGACTGTGACQVALTDYKAVTAHFALDGIPGYTLQVTRAGTGSGKVRSPYAGIDCGLDCSRTFSPDTSFTLMAVADPGSVFTGWTGACSGTGNCSLTMTADAAVAANFDLPTCSSSLDLAEATVTAAGGQASIAVSSSPGCPWSAASYSPWVQIVTGGSGVGNGSITYAVDPNSGPARIAVLLVAGTRFTIRQSAGCTVGILPSAVSLEPGGGAGTATISGDCEWSAISDVPWISITGAVNGTGPGTIQYSVLPNWAGGPRVGCLSVGDQVLTITQAGVSCPVTLPASYRSISALGGTFQTELEVPGGCSWTAESLVSWISLGSTNGTGNATLNYSVEANPAGVSRTGQVKINDRTLEVTQAGLNTWFSSGPDGVAPSGFAAHPSNPGVVYALASRWGVLKSTDGGLNWRASNTGLSGSQYNFILVTQADPRVLWLTGTDGTYKSTDSGDSWIKIRSDSYTCLATDPFAPEVIYFSNTTLWKLTNGLNLVSLPGSPASVNVLTLDPTDGSRIYAANAAGIHRSTNAGVTWSQVYTVASGLSISQLTIVPGSPPSVYASTSSGLLKSGDDGNTWEWIYETLTPGSGETCVTYNKFAPDELYYSADRAIMRSLDGGESWTLLSDLRFTPEILLRGGNGFKVLVVGGEDGISVWSQSDGWKKANTGTGRSASFVAVDPSNSSVHASSPPDLLLSSDHGSTWAGDDAAPADGLRLIFDPSNPLTQYRYGGDALHKSTDGGLTWARKGQSSYPSARLIEVDPSDPQRLYALAANFVFTSGDGGESWGRTTGAGLPSNQAGCLLFRPAQPGALYAAVNDRLFRTLDRGETWAAMSQSSAWGSIYVLKNDPLDPQAVYAGSTTSNGLARSTDLGASWSQVKTGGVHHIEFDSLNPSRMWIASPNQISFSPDAGRSWYGFRPLGLTPWSFALDRTDPNNLYAAANEGLFSMRTGTECSAQLELQEASFSASGGTGSVPVTALSGCTWLVRSSSSWITVTSPSSSSGNSTVTYRVAENYGVAREGGLLIAGRHFPIRQGAGTGSGTGTCSYSLSGSAADISAGGGAGSFWIQRGYGSSNSCQFPIPLSNQDWIKPYPAVSYYSSYSAYVSFIVAPNTGSPGAPASARTGTITIGGLIFTVIQAGSPVLTVTKEGSGIGTVASLTAGIACGPDCTETVEPHTQLTLTATPAPGSFFAGWTGGGCSGTGACQVTVHASKTVTATFSLLSCPLEVSLLGEGDGVVRSTPGGIDCGATCSASFLNGTEVSLTASPGSGATFIGWSGACSGSGACQITMDQAQTVGATFSYADCSWANGAQMPSHRLAIHAGIAVVRNKISVIGHHDGQYWQARVNEEYDPATNTWATKTAYPRPEGRMRLNSNAVVGDTMYFFGGANGSDYYHTQTVDTYNAVTDTWHLDVAQYPVPVGSLATTTINGLIYCFGGNNHNQPAYRAGYRFDPTNGSFTPLAQAPVGRIQPKSLVHDDSIWVAGGYNSDPNYTILDTIDVYDPSADAWAPGPTLPRSDKVLQWIGKLADGAIYAVYSDTNPLIYRYRTATGDWEEMCQAPIAQDSFGVAAVGTRIFTIGGPESAGASTLQVFSAATGVDVFFASPNHAVYRLRTNRRADYASSAAIPGGGASSHSPALAVFQDRQYMAVKGATDSSIYIKSRARDGSFADTAWTQLSGTTSSSPALCTFNNRLYLFIKGGSSNALFYRSMGSSGVWSGWSQVPGANTLWRPGLVVFGGRLYCFATHATTYGLWYKSMDAAEAWSPWIGVSTGSTNAAPTPIVHDGKVWLFVKGLAGKLLWWCATATPDTPASWSPWAACNGSSEAAPGVALDPEENVFHLVVRGNMVPRIWHRTLDPATLVWSDWHLLTNLEPAAQSIDAPTVVPANWGVQPMLPTGF